MPTSDLFSGAYFGNMASYVPTRFDDVADDTFEATVRGRQPSAYLLSVAEEGRAFSERNDLIRQRFGRDIVQEVKQEFPEAGADFLVSEYQRRTDQMIEDGRKQNLDAWAGIRKADEIEAETIDKAQVAQIESERTSARAESDFARYGGSLAGGAAATFVDPINIATIPFGAAAGTGILRGALIDGALNMAVEAAEAPLNAEWQKKLGFKYGLSEGLADVATAGIGGAALSTIIRGGSKALGHLTGRSEKILRDIANERANPSEVRAAANYMERVAHVDENIPPLARADESLSPMDVLATHRASLQETQEAFRQNRPPVYSEDIPFDFSEPLPPREVPPARSFNEGAAIEGKYTSYTTPTPQELRYMEGAVIQLQQAEKGAILMQEQSGQGGSAKVIKSAENTFPEWFRSMNKEGESLSREYVAKVFEKVKQNQPLGKKEVRVAKALFEEAKAAREENARQILDFRQERTAIRNDQANAEIDALAAREAAAEMADPYLEPETNAAKRLADDVRAGEETEMMDAARADFERLLAEEPEFSIVMEDGNTRTAKELADELAEDGTILQAVTVCGVG